MWLAGCSIQSVKWTTCIKSVIKKKLVQCRAMKRGVAHGEESRFWLCRDWIIRLWHSSRVGSDTSAGGAGVCRTMLESSWQAASLQSRPQWTYDDTFLLFLHHFLQIHADFHCDKDDRVWWGLEVFWKNLCIIEATLVENAVFIDNPAASPAIPDHLHDSIIDQI